MAVIQPFILCICPALNITSCYFFTDQRVASFCTLNDMQQAQGLEGAQELPLDESPTDGKDFLEATGYVEIRAHFLHKYFKKRLSLNVECRIACMDVSLLFDGRPVTLTDLFFNFEKCCFLEPISEQFCLQNLSYCQIKLSYQKRPLMQSIVRFRVSANQILCCIPPVE